MTFDPTAPAFVADPYPVYARLREDAPVHRAPSGAWVLTRYADVHAALGDDRLRNAPARYAVVAPRNRERYVCASVASHILPFLDPPEHTEPRRVIGRAFADRLRSRPPDFAELAGTLVDRWTSGALDLVADFASPLSVHVISSMLGIPEVDRTKLEGWSETFFYLFASIPSRAVRDQLDEDLTAFRAYLAALAADRHAEPHDDLISDLVSDPRLPMETVIDNLMLLFADGVENVDRAIANGVWALLRDGAAWHALIEEPGLIPSAVDECLRFESPGQYIARIADEPIELHGTEIPAESTVLLVLGSANRDPLAFDDADTLDVRRDPNPHLAFGRGRHSCIGGPLVERQMAGAFDALVRRVPGLSLTEHDPTWVPRPAHRWIERLVVERGPRA